MKRTSRVLAAVVAASALTFTGVHTADAKPAHAGSHAKADKAAKAKSGKGSTSKLERAVARKVAQLEGTVTDQRLRRVDQTLAGMVKLNVAEDVEALRLLVAPADPAATETAPVTDVRATLKSYRPENYRLAVNILRQAAQLEQEPVAETTEAETDAVDASVALAVELNATSSKTDVKAARAAFREAAGLIEEDADEAAEAGETDETADDEDGSDGDATLPSPDNEYLSGPVDAPEWTSGS
jgi:hypothetical protein